MKKRVAIVGGGVSGLSVAEALARLAGDVELETIVLEAAPQVGGKIVTERVDGFVVESGPHGFLDKEPKVAELVERLGLGPSLIQADDASSARYIMRAGALRAAPTGPGSFLRSAILPKRAKLRLALEPLSKGPPGHEETVYEFASRRIGAAAADVLIDAMVTGIYAGDPRMLSVAAAFPRVVELEAEYGGLIRGQIAVARQRRKERERTGFGGPGGVLQSFKAGLGELIHSLAARANVRTGARVGAVTLADGGFELRLGADDASGAEVLGVDAVVLTCPTFESARLLAPLSDETRPLGRIPYAPVAVVVHGFEDRVFGPQRLDGFGFLIPERERQEILGSIWASSVFPVHAPPGLAMTRTLLGGSRHPSRADGDDDELGGRALDAMLRCLRPQFLAPGVAPEPVMQKVFRWDRGIPQYELGHFDRVAAADRVERAIPGVFLGGNGLRGVAMIQCVVDGERVAQRVLSHFGAPVAHR